MDSVLSSLKLTSRAASSAFPSSPSRPLNISGPSHARAASASGFTAASSPPDSTASASSVSPRMASPIAASGYHPKVSFNTFEVSIDSAPPTSVISASSSSALYSYTLSVKSEGYHRSHRTRVFLCAASPDESGSQALEWCLGMLVQDGDELIVCRGVDPTDDRDVRDDARNFLVHVQQMALQFDPDRKLSIVLEYVCTKCIGDTIERLIALYCPDSVVVGSRGKRTWQIALAGSVGASRTMGAGMGIGSVSKYILARSPVPVIVVRPESNVRKTVEKRRADPRRGTHFESVDKESGN
ncbi:hypothetical protein FISHEDRAFT_73295 [Fistulina hepatica ATCC 64428]|uniref:UspA domain-containing protein n=1 Tax=Fistulina hepatica ATCC 64428 TaxID=1128425 RepID=A0A0D7AD26_9AGAR|nr:hypothetical protein FISHEDRAFT_73295 [Fistulina hepatica ATCC 64428]